MTEHILHLHPAAPEKPAFGQSCNGCGVCCAFAGFIGRNMTSWLDQQGYLVDPQNPKTPIGEFEFEMTECLN